MALGRSRRDEKLDACVKRIFESEGVPAFCEHVSDVLAHTVSLETTSVELARIILKDLGLTSQTLRIVNSAMYNRSDRPILSVAHAVIMLGWDAVRNMLSAIRYIEHFANVSPGIRELMLLSVLDAVHSRDVASVLGYPYPEEAYVCGLFRNLGEVLVACHYPKEYSSIILAMQTEKIPARVACLRYLDFSWDDLGRRLAEAWNMPRKVHLCMRESDAASTSVLERSLFSITNYTHDLTHALYRKGDGIESVHLRYVINPEGVQTLVSVRELHKIVDSAAVETEKTFSQLGIPRERLLLGQQAERARHIIECTTVFDDVVLKTLDDAIDSALERLESDDFELSDLITSLLDALCAAGFDRAVFGLLNESHTVVRGRLASGANAEDVLAGFHFAVDRADGPIRAALVRKTDVLVERARDDRYDKSVLVTTLTPAAFALFPNVTDGKAVACLYADRKSASPGLVNARSALGRARDAIGLAIRKKARMSAASGLGVAG